MEKVLSNSIRFNYLTDPFTFKDRRRLKNFLLGLFKKEGKQVNIINYIFCTDEYLLHINTQYLRHEDYTDIITFDFSPQGEAITSDIYISIERVKENAGVFAVPIYQELHRVIFHGALHLCGYKDKTKSAALLMRSMEQFCLDSYFVSREN